MAHRAWSLSLEQDDGGAKHCDRVFEAGDRIDIDEIAGAATDEDISRTDIENVFWSPQARIRPSQRCVRITVALNHFPGFISWSYTISNDWGPTLICPLNGLSMAANRKIIKPRRPENITVIQKCILWLLM